MFWSADAMIHFRGLATDLADIPNFQLFPDIKIAY